MLYNNKKTLEVSFNLPIRTHRRKPGHLLCILMRVINKKIINI